MIPEFTVLLSMASGAFAIYDIHSIPLVKTLLINKPGGREESLARIVQGPTHSSHRFCVRWGKGRELAGALGPGLIPFSLVLCIYTCRLLFRALLFFPSFTREKVM